MRAVVDTNVLFSFFRKDSLTRKILIFPGNYFISPEFAIKEFKKHSGLICSKTRISKFNFSRELKKMKSFVKIIPKKNYENFLANAQKFSPDKDDSEFIALCLKLNLPLWSNDKLLKTQDKIAVLNTKDLIEILF
jgi:predicted nucleic acid-binding protein